MEPFIHWLEKHLLTCPYRALTGFDCPGCGIQRSFIELLRGNFTESFFLYPALLPVLFILLFTGLHLIFKFRKGAETIKYSFIGTTGIIVVSYILKMCL
jgi:hypothetical protein